MSLDEDAGLFLVDLTQFFPRGNGFVHALSEWQRESDAGAVAANSAEIGQAIADRVLQAGHGLRQHDGQRIFAGAARAGKDERGRHALRRDRLPQMADRRVISRKLIEAHINETSKKPAGDFPWRRIDGLPHIDEKLARCVAPKGARDYGQRFRHMCAGERDAAVQRGSGTNIIGYLGRSVILGCTSTVCPGTNRQPPFLCDGGQHQNPFHPGKSLADTLPAAGAEGKIGKARAAWPFVPGESVRDRSAKGRENIPRCAE